MKKHLFLTVMMLAALTLLWGCHHSSNDPDPEPEPDPGPGPVNPTPSPWLSVSEKPDWQIDWSANDTRPAWEEPDVADYETWMIIMVRLPEVIAPYVSDDDMMAVFINDEIRGLSTKATFLNNEGEEAVNEEYAYFILKVYGNLGSNRKELFCIKYYSSQLHQLFSVEGEEMFVPEGDYGVTNDFIPPLLFGSSKYPVVMYWAVGFTIDMDQQEPLMPSPGDIVAAFVDGECRGCDVIGDRLFSGRVALTVYSKQAGEHITLKYYSVSKKAIRVFENVATTKSGNSTLQLSI